MYKEKEAEELFLRVLSDLEDYLPYLVLVGGWVPFLYARHLWGVKRLPTRTVDIDFGFGRIKPKKVTRPLSKKLASLGYGEHHVSMDRLFPYVPIAQTRGGHIRFDVEFITDVKTTEQAREDLLGREIKVNRIDRFEILLEATMPLGLEAQGKRLEVIIPTPEAFCFHKLLTFVDRKVLDKRKKDIHYAYYVLRFHPGSDEFMEVLARAYGKRRECKDVIRNLREYFRDEFSAGPRMIEELHGPDDFIQNIRADAYARGQALLDVLSARSTGAART